MTIDPKKSGASPSAPTWDNWSGNIVHEPPTNGANYYFRPTNLVELKSVLADAVTKDPDKLLKFFAHVEREWVRLGGLPQTARCSVSTTRPTPPWIPIRRRSTRSS